MAAKSLGKVTTSSTTVPVRATNNETTASHQYSAQGFMCQALAANTGVVYICTTATPTIASLTGVLAIVPIPSSSDGKSLPMVTVNNPVSAGAFNMAEIYILPAVTNEGVLIGVVRT